jgi:hypothetical protein
MSRIDRIRHTLSSRRAARADEKRIDEGEAAAASNLPVPVGPAVTVARPPRGESRRGETELSAHLIGQDGQRRGLRAGPTLLDIARHAYSRIEWSGAWDRRARNGRRANTDI